MKAGFPKRRSTRDRETSASFRRRLRLRSEKQSKRLCENRRDGYPDHPAPRPSWGSLRPLWIRRFGRSTSTRIASRLRRGLEDPRLTIGSDCPGMPGHISCINLAVPCLTSYLFSAFAASYFGVSLDRSNFEYGEDNSQV